MPAPDLRWAQPAEGIAEGVAAVRDGAAQVGKKSGGGSGRLADEGAFEPGRRRIRGGQGGSRGGELGLRGREALRLRVLRSPDAVHPPISV